MDIAVLTISALVAIRYGGQFGDWFTAERGAGDGKNGWV